MLSRFHLVPERNGQTDGRTDRQTDLLYQYRASVGLHLVIIIIIIIILLTSSLWI